ncbi:MAG: DNA repair protein RadC [Halieaceae bacterium]
MAKQGRVAADNPKEKLLSKGATALSDAELLTILLRTGRSRSDRLADATELLSQFDGPAGILAAESSRLLNAAGVGRASLVLLRAASELVRRSAEQGLREDEVLTSPAQTRRFLQYHLGARDREVFSCLFLDSQHRLLRCDDLFLGTLDGAAVYPREVAVHALRYRAAAVILAHNHPSGVAEPSSADKRITERLCAALALLDVRVLDHIIVGRGQCFSFAEQGLI